MSTIQIPSQSFIEELKQKDIPLRMEYLSSGTNITELPQSNVLEFALVGRSNVGKSSLLNYIAGQKNLARVSNTPGRTQMINLFSVEKTQFIIADLPGYGYAESPRETKLHWEKSMQSYFENRDGLFCVLFLIDMRRELVPQDESLSRWLQSMGIKIIGVQTKCDKIHKSKWQSVRKSHALKLALLEEQIVTTSADKKIGLQNLLTMMAGQIDAFEN